MTSPSPHDVDPVLLLQVLEQVVCGAAIDQLCREHGVKVRRGIYTLPILIRLMIYQRLNGKRTLSSAVHWLANNALERDDNHRSKRVLEGRVSVATGGYCQARQNLPTLVATTVADHIFEQLQAHMREQASAADTDRPIFVIDGTTLRLPHEKDLVTAFPPGTNQHGENHWPTLLMVAFHDARTGLATRPSWGAMYGPEAVSEQALAERALQRLPADAIALTDGNFGIFAFAYAVDQSQRQVISRLTAVRARKVAGEAKLRSGHRHRVIWEPSAHERKVHPNLPPQATITGWVVACRNPSKRQEILYFFTTLDLKPSRILALYKLRWNIETDLLSLKRTVSLHQVTSRSKSMVEKDLLMAVSAYNVVRAVMYLAASRTGINPRQLSFSAAQDAVLAAWPHLQAADTPAEFQRQLDRLLQIVSRVKLPRRSRRRSYPREIWGRGGRFPFRKSRPTKEDGQG